MDPRSNTVLDGCSQAPKIQPVCFNHHNLSWMPSCDWPGGPGHTGRGGRMIPHWHPEDFEDGDGGHLSIPDYSNLKPGMGDGPSGWPRMIPHPESRMGMGVHPRFQQIGEGPSPGPAISANRGCDPWGIPIPRAAGANRGRGVTGDGGDGELGIGPGVSAPGLLEQNRRERSAARVARARNRARPRLTRVVGASNLKYSTFNSQDY